MFHRNVMDTKTDRSKKSLAFGLSREKKKKIRREFVPPCGRPCTKYYIEKRQQKLSVFNSPIKPDVYDI